MSHKPLPCESEIPQKQRTARIRRIRRCGNGDNREIAGKSADVDVIVVVLCFFAFGGTTFAKFMLASVAPVLFSSTLRFFDLT
jgi:hypothetical protein